MPFNTSCRYFGAYSFIVLHRSMLDHSFHLYRRSYRSHSPSTAIFSHSLQLPFSQLQYTRFAHLLTFFAQGLPPYLLPTTFDSHTLLVIRFPLIQSTCPNYFSKLFGPLYHSWFLSTQFCTSVLYSTFYPSWSLYTFSVDTSST